MILAASDASHENVELLVAPEDAVVGERVRFGDSDEPQAEPQTPNQIQKKKTWEELQPLLRTNDACVPTYEGAPMMTSAGAVACATLVGKLIELLLGHPITVHGVRRALKKMDQDDSGFVSFGEFESWWRERCARLFCNTRGLFWPLCCDVSSSVAVCKLCRSSLGMCSWRGARELYDPAHGQRK